MQKKIFSIIGIVLLLSLIAGGVYYFGFINQSVFGTFNRKLVATDIDRTVDKTEYAILHIEFKQHMTSPESMCKEFPSTIFHVSEPIRINLPNIPFTLHTDVDYTLNYDLSDLATNQDSELISVVDNTIFENLQHCGGAYEGQALIKNKNIVCKVLSPTSLNCIMDFDVEGTSASGKIKSVYGSFDVKLYKTGYPIVEEEEEEIVEDEIEEPEKPTPTGFSNLMSLIFNWILGILDFFKLQTTQSIIGADIITPGTQESYSISLETNIPDSDYSNGSYQVQYGNWALVNGEGEIISEGEWEEVFGTYTKDVKIQIPSKLDDHALIGVINQYDMNYDFDTNKWVITNEEIVTKEGINLQTKLSAPEKPTPFFSKLKNIIQSIFDWFRNL